MKRITMEIKMNEKKEYKHYTFIVEERGYKIKYKVLGDNDAVDFRFEKEPISESMTIETRPSYDLRTVGDSCIWNPNRFNAICLGDNHTCRGEYQSTTFTCHEYVEDAKAEFKLQQERQGNAQKGYYSQQWV
jgi:hypothetical protein